MSNESNKHGSVLVAAGDSGATQDVLDVSGNRNIDLSDIHISYSDAGTTTARVELFDEPAGTGAGDVGDENRLHASLISPGDNQDNVDITREDVQHDVVALVNNNDDEVAIVVSGEAV